MGLIEKKLMQLQNGTQVELTLLDSARSVITGIVSDNDNSSALELSNGTETNIISYDDVRNVKVITTPTSYPPKSSALVSPEEPVYTQKQPTAVEKKLSPVPAVQPAATKKASLCNLFSFEKEIQFPRFSDSQLDAMFKACFSNDEKRILNNYYQALKSHMKSGDKERAKATFLKMTNALENLENVKPGGIRFANGVAIRLNQPPLFELLLKNKLYDHLAIYAQLHQYEPMQCIAYACLGLAFSDEYTDKDIVYTVLAANCEKVNSYGCLVKLLSLNAALILDRQLQELLNRAGSMLGIPYTAQNSNEIVRILTSDASATAFSLYIDSQLSQHENKQEEKATQTPPVQNTPDVYTNSDYQAVKLSLKGYIISLKWSTERGTIKATDGTLYQFSYVDIADEKLLKKIRALMLSDLVKNNATEPVSFEVQSDKVSNIRSCRFQDKTVESVNGVTVKYAGHESSLKIARDIQASSSPNRMENALHYFLLAMEEEKDISAPLAESVNCCLAVAKTPGYEDYAQKAYDLYLQYKERADRENSMTVNATMLNLCQKTGRLSEGLVFINRILSDPKLAVETRLNYLYQKACISTQIADTMTTEEYTEKQITAAYQTAMLSFKDWEQRYLDRLELSQSQGYRLLYNTSILFGIAKCEAKCGNREEAEKLIKRVLFFKNDYEPALTLKRLLSEQKIPQAEENNLQVETDLDESETEAENNKTEDNDAYIENTADTPEEEPDENDEEQDGFDDSILQIYTDVDGFEALNLTREQILSYTFSLRGQNRIPVALTYLKAASDLNEALLPDYRLLSEAADNPMEKTDYSLLHVLQRFSQVDKNGNGFYGFAKAACLLRGAFYHTADNDYFTAGAYLDEDITTLLPALPDTVALLDRFRSQTGRGLEPFTQYRINTAENMSQRLKKLQQRAEELHDLYYNRHFRETATKKRFKLTKAKMFEKNGILERLLIGISENRTEDAELKKEFCTQFIRENSLPCLANLEPEALDTFIDDIWRNALEFKKSRERVSEKLIGSLRNNLKTPLKHITELFCEWLSLTEEALLNSSAEALTVAAEITPRLTDSLSELITQCKTLEADTDDRISMGAAVITLTAEEFLQKLNGTYREEKRKYFFADFLSTDLVLLDEDFLPDVSSTFCGLEDFNILERIKRHVQTQNANAEDYLQNIFTKEPEKHNFGTAKYIAQYLQYKDGETAPQLPDNYDELCHYAEGRFKIGFDRFHTAVDTAVSRGQLDNTVPFFLTVNETLWYWFKYCDERKEYGFFASLLKSVENMIQTRAVAYGEVLKQQFEKLCQTYRISDANRDKINRFIEERSYTVAEEMMSRITKDDAGHTETTTEKATTVLSQFWDEFDRNYRLMNGGAGVTLEKLVASRAARKDRKGGENLIAAWPRSTRVTEVQMQSLIKHLGFMDCEVESCKLDAVPLPVFKVKQSNRLFTKREYAHPLAAFGTQSAENGFYAVCYFGYADCTRLMDLCRKLDSVPGNKLILADYVLTAAQRRLLAKQMKQSTFANTYILVDRIGILFLANHYIGGGLDDNNRTLMAISMPFTYYQPYILGSTVATPPELFAGRREELLSVESPTGANLLYGGRQLGKSAILRKAANEVHDPENSRYAFVIDIKDKKCTQAVLAISRYLNTEGIFSDEQLTDDWDTFEFYLRKNIKEKEISYLLLMLDEADVFIEDCKNFNYAPFVGLKNLQQSSNEHFKFVLAGLHDLVKFKREVSLGNNSVIPHLNYINVKPFDFSTAKRLLSEPLSYLGFDFGSDEDSEAAFMQIFSATNYYPGLIQMFCNKLIENLRSNYGGYNEATVPPYKVTGEQINRVLADREFQSEIKRKFEITLRLGQDNYYYIIALLLAVMLSEQESAEGYTMQSIVDMGNELGIDLFRVFTEETLQASLEELCELNILKVIDDGYTFRTKSFRNLLGTRDKLLNELIKYVGNTNEADTEE